MDHEPSLPGKFGVLLPILVVAAVVVVVGAFLALALSRSDPAPAIPDRTATQTAAATPSPTQRPSSIATVTATAAVVSPTAAPNATAPTGSTAPPAPPSNVSASIVNWIPSTCTITVDAIWKDNSNNETGFLIGPPSSKQVLFAGYTVAAANATSVRFTFTYGGGTFPVFIWAIRDTGSARVWSEGPVAGIFLSPTPPTTCP